MRSEVAAILLTGGRSRRMGRDKAGVMLAGRTLLERTAEVASSVADTVLVVAAPGQMLPTLASDLDVRVVRDAGEGAGPLAGLLNGLAAVEAPLAVVLACDMPFVRPALLRLLLGALADAAAAVPVHEGRPQPLCSAVRTDTLPALHALFEAGARDASALTRVRGAHLLQPDEWHGADPEGVSFFSVNTPADLECAEVLAKRQTHHG